MKRSYFFLVVLGIILIGSFASAEKFFPTEQFGYGRTEDIPVNFSELPTVNSSDNWITDIGIAGTVDSAQFNIIGDTLTIDESHIELIGNAWWLRLDGTTTPTADIDWDGFDINGVGNITANNFLGGNGFFGNATINDRLFFGDSDHWISKGAVGFNGLSTNAIALQHGEEHAGGTIGFIVTGNKTGATNDVVMIMAQLGLNNSAGYLGNSWMFAPNNLTNNLTDLSNCFFVINATGNTPRISCDTSETGADIFVQDDIQSGGTVFADGGIRAEELASFIMMGNDFQIQNGSLHIFTPVTFEQGVVEGQEIVKFQEFFLGGLGSFTNIQTDSSNWFSTSSIFCDDGDCAESIGISGNGNIIMEANISTDNANSTSFNFVYSLVNIIGADSFTITANNNVGSGDVVLFTDNTASVVTSPQSITMPSSMWDQPLVTIQVECDATQSTRACYIDTISVNGTAIATTLTNVSGFNSVWKMSDGALASDGFPERGIFYVAENDTIVIRGNATFENIIEQDLNITSSITLNSSTIFDWADIVNTPLFPEYFLTNGSSVMQGNTNFGGNELNNVSVIDGGGSAIVVKDDVDLGGNKITNVDELDVIVIRGSVLGGIDVIDKLVMAADINMQTNTLKFGIGTLKNGVIDFGTNTLNDIGWFGNLTVDGNITADYYFGNGKFLTNLTEQPAWGFVEDGAIAFWQFEGNLLDAIGNNDDGTGDATFSGVIVGKAATFSGSQKITIPDSEDLDFTDFNSEFAIELMMNTDDVSLSTSPLFEKGDYKIEFVSGGDIVASADTTEISFSGIEDFENYHIVFTWDRSDSKLYLYVNGQRVNETDYSLTDDATGDIILGDGFTGLIDELVIYDKVLPASTVSTHYEKTKTSPSPTNYFSDNVIWNIINNTANTDFNITTTNNITADTYFGDGSQLTGITQLWENISGVATYDGNINVTGNITTGTAFLELINFGTNTMFNGNFTGDWDINGGDLDDIGTADVDTIIFDNDPRKFLTFVEGAGGNSITFAGIASGPPNTEHSFTVNFGFTSFGNPAFHGGDPSNQEDGVWDLGRPGPGPDAGRFNDGYFKGSLFIDTDINLGGDIDVGGVLDVTGAISGDSFLAGDFVSGIDNVGFLTSVGIDNDFGAFTVSADGIGLVDIGYGGIAFDGSQGDGKFTGTIITGTNTVSGLSAGDINVSTVFYDTLTAKSPMFMCSDDWCSVGFPKYQRTLWLQKDDNYTILDIVYQEEHYTKQTFWNLVQGTQYEEMALKLNNKIQNLQDKKQADILLQQQKDNCNHRWDGECFEIVRVDTTYEGAVEITQVESMIIIIQNVTQLNPITFMIEIVEKEVYVGTGEMVDKYHFKESCGWDGDYYCRVREIK